MQISSHPPEQVTTREHVETANTLRCPVCSGALVPMHNSYRCSHCSFHLCASCDAMEPEALNHGYLTSPKR
jgi:hypothetical protein